MKLGNYEVRFNYIWYDNGDRYPIAVECAIQKLPLDEQWPQWVGDAHCHPKDNFNKEFGRKLSLTRAMFMAGLDKTERTQIWKDYFNRKKS